MAARAHAEIRAIVVFHGFAFRPAGAQPGAEPYDLAGGVNVPMLVLHGTEDERAPIADMRRMEARMRALDKACTFRFYDGARHGFAVRTHPGYAEDAAKQSFDEARRYRNPLEFLAESGRSTRQATVRVIPRIPSERHVHDVFAKKEYRAITLRARRGRSPPRQEVGR
jgi:dienelactone hydrolase